MYICPYCAQPVARTRQGRVAPHRLTQYSERLCKGGGQQPLRDSRRASRDAELAKQKSGTELPVPGWLPPWRQRYPASLALPASGALRIWLPNTSSLGHIAAIDAAMRTETRPTWDVHQECWTVPKNHFLLMAGKLAARHMHLMIGREYNPGEKCNSSCKNAQGPYCTCSCLAKYHGRGKWMKGLTPVDEFGTNYHLESWYWRIVTAAR